jgi:hypothetical protein
MTRIWNALESEHHTPVMNSLQPNNWHVMDDFTLGVCCSAQTLFCKGRHQRRLGNRTLETNPHTLALGLHGGWYGHLHAWKACVTCGSCDHGCCRCSDAVCRGIHCCEDYDEFAAFLPSNRRWQAVFSYDQHYHWKTSFQTSHAGKEMSCIHYTLRRSMGAPEFPEKNDCGLTPARASGKRELIIQRGRN